jgi:hypothetical protein
MCDTFWLECFLWWGESSGIISLRLEQQWVVFSCRCCSIAPGSWQLETQRDEKINAIVLAMLNAASTCLLQQKLTNGEGQVRTNCSGDICWKVCLKRQRTLNGAEMYKNAPVRRTGFSLNRLSLICSSEFIAYFLWVSPVTVIVMIKIC